MRSVLGAIATYLKADPELAALLEGGNIWDINQPPDEQHMPVVTLLWQENAQLNASRGLRLGMLEVDIWDWEGSTERIEKIRDQIEYLLDRRILTVGERQWARFFIGAEAQVPTEINENLVHWTLDFDVRYWRQGWLARVLAE